MSEKREQNLKTLIRLLKEKGYGAEEISGMLGSMRGETPEFDPTTEQGGGGPGYGIAQWEGERKKRLKEKEGYDTLEGQVDFLDEEIKGLGKDQYNKYMYDKFVKKGKDPANLAELFTRYFERPATSIWEDGDSLKGRLNRKKTPVTEEEAKRGKYAEDIFKKYLKPEVDAEAMLKFGAPVDEGVPALLNPDSQGKPMFEDGGIVAPSRMATPDEYNYIKLLKKAKEQGSQLLPDPEAALDFKTMKMLGKAKPLAKKAASLAGPIGAGIGAALLSGDAQAGLGELLGSDPVGQGSDEIPGRAMPISPAEMKEAKEKYAPLLDSPELLKQYRELMTKEKAYQDGGLVENKMDDFFEEMTGMNYTQNPVLDMVEEANQDIPEQPLNQKPEPMSDEEPKAAREQALINEIAGLGGEKKVEKTAKSDQKRKPASEDNLDLQSEYKSLLEQLRKPRSTEKSDALKKAEWMDAISSIAGSLDRYGREPRTPGRQTQFAKQVAAQEAKSTGMDALKSRAAILKQLQDLKKGSKSGFSNDPKSAESLNMADKLKKLYGVDYGGMSEAAMVKAFPGLVSTDRAKFLEKGKESRHKQRFEFKANETEAKRMEKIVSDFNSDPIMRDSKKAIIAADKAETIIKKGGKLAPAVMGRLLARMAGEVGVMTDQDVAAFKGSPQWTDSLQRWFKRGISGKLTKTDKQEMLKMVNNLRTVERSAIAGYADTLAKQYSNASGLSRKRIMSSILPKESSELFEVSDKVKIQAPNGETRLVDKKSVQKYLDRGGKIIED